MNERDAIAALVSDLHWQIDQMAPRGIKDRAGNVYNPSYYKRGLQRAIDRGGREPAEYILRYLGKPPSDGYRKLEDADSLHLACEALIADPDKPYAWLFTPEQRHAARDRLAHHLREIERRRAETRTRIDDQRAQLPDDVKELKVLAATDPEPERSVAINSAILAKDPRDIPSLNRLGRAYAAIGAHDQAEQAFCGALELDPSNTIAKRWLHELESKKR